MRQIVAGVLGVLAVAATAPGAAAQGLEYRPIDTNKFVVQPTDAATNIVSGTAKTLTRAMAAIIENNAIVRTVNNVFSREATSTPTQPGPSPLPYPGSYPSTRYQSPLTPALPTYQTHGRTPGTR